MHTGSSEHHDQHAALLRTNTHTMSDSTAPPVNNHTLVNSAHHELANAIRQHYHRFVASIRGVIEDNADSTVLVRLGDDLDEYLAIVNEVSKWHPGFLCNCH